MSAKPLLLPWLLLPALAAGFHAQSSAAEAAPSPTAVGTSVGLRAIDGGLRGGGPGYRVDFDARGASFVPALGATAQRTYPLSFELESVTVGDVRLDLAAVEPIAADDAVEYHRGGLVERYALGSKGVEQSFRFDALPARGDIVVRGRLATDLPLASADPLDGLRFEERGLGGVSFGGVTGIDAEGNAARGWVRLEGDRVELGLPADFVRDAALPLVLDPLIGTLFDVNDGGPDDTEVDVAYENNRYLVVWTRTFAAGDTEIRGQRVNTDGTLAGGLLLISTSDENTAPSVGASGNNGLYLVAWEHREGGNDSDIYLASVTPTGVVSPEVELGLDFYDEDQPDVGHGPSKVTVAWHREGFGIYGARIGFFPGNDEPFVDQTFPLSSDPDDRFPAISQSEADDYRFVTWRRSSIGVLNFVYGRRWTGEPDSSEPEFLIHSSTNLLGNPDCATGTSDDYMVVWHISGSLPGLNRDVWGKRVFFPGGEAGLGDAFAISNESDHEEYDPSVAYTPGEYVVTFLDESDDENRFRVRGFDPMSGNTLETLNVNYPNRELVAAALGGGASAFLPDPAEVLVAFITNDDDGGDVSAVLYGSKTDVPERLQYGCPGVGKPRASAVVSPNTGHRQELWEAAPNTPALLAVSWQQAIFPFGGGTLGIDPTAFVVFDAGLTDADGYVGVDAPMPSLLVGAELWFQWALIPAPGTACTTLEVDLTDTLYSVVD
ncbi:MAG: hypothetical protein AAF682_04130 [Planctomycetota bacterium]